MTNILRAARLEMETCKRSKDPEERLVACQQAAEKAWNHVNRAARVALQVSGREANYEIRDALGEMVRCDTEKQPILDQYVLLQDYLHGDCFRDQRTYACRPEFVEPRIDMAEALAIQLQKVLPKYRYAVGRQHRTL